MQEFVLQPLSSPLGHGGPGPSVYLVDDFVTALEVRELRRHAYECFARKLGAGRSFEQSWLAFDSKPSPVVTDHVGSATCPPGGAAELLARVDERIGRLGGIPPHAAEEPFMLSRQQPEVPTKDAFENLHHDKINEDKERRAATVLVYLSDSDDAEGGHTIFPALPPAADGPTGEAANRTLAEVERSLSEAFARGARALGCQACAQRGTPPPSAQAAAALEAAREHAAAECARARRGAATALAVRPKKGRALVFWSVVGGGGEGAGGRGLGAAPDARMWHAGCLARGGAGRVALQKFKQPLPGEAWEDGAGGGAQLAAAAAVGADQGGRLDGGAGGEPSTRRVAVDAAGRTAAASGSREDG